MEKKENRNSYSELPEGEESSAAKASRKEPRKGKDIRELRILKKSKSIKEKNDPERFDGDGINFRAKIIGIEDVFDARGNRMCQGALQKLKAAVKTSGDHKQRIILNISLKGIIIKDEKSGEILHHHPIHKISCISQDTKDNRAFGFVYGCPQTGHRFFAIKTEKAASQVVVTLRDLFMVALQIKQKEIDRTVEKENGDHENNTEKEEKKDEPAANIDGLSNGSGPTFFPAELEKNEVRTINQDFFYSNTVLLPEEDAEDTRNESCGAVSEVVSDALLDLQSEVNILQQGISEMERSISHTISQSLGISLSEDEISESSTSSFPASFQLKVDKLSSLCHETVSISSRSSSTSDYNVFASESRQEGNDTPKRDPFRSSTSAVSEGCASAVSSLSINGSASEISNADSTAPSSVIEDRYAVFLDIDSLPSIFDNPNIVKAPNENIEVSCTIPDCAQGIEEIKIKTSPSTAFAALDPLGNQPFIDKRDFFQDIKKPPKKILKDLAGTNAFGDFDSETLSNSQECLTFNDLKLSHPEGSPGGIAVNPPKLPPKRVVGLSSFPVMSELFQESGLSSNGAWESKNPFNLFQEEDYSDMPPPNSPPPPPPPRLPTKSSESSPSMSPPPPPRPPSRVNGVPTPPLPKRKVPLCSTNRTWCSFDQDTVSFPAVPLLPADSEAGANYMAPPLPSPARKLPPHKPESALLKSSSASNSPATMRRLYSKIYVGNTSVIKENSDSYSPYIENGVISENKESKTNILTSSPRKTLSRHFSIAQDGDAFSSATFNPFLEFCDSHSESASHEEILSPPLPPKPPSISQPKTSPVERPVAAPCTSPFSVSNVSATESSTGTRSSSSLAFTSSDENKVSSSSEALFTSSSGSQSDVFAQEVFQPQSSIDMTEENPVVPDLSPDSIFRRKSDPFADDFFLSLCKKSNGDSQLLTKESSTHVEPFDNIKAPT